MFLSETCWSSGVPIEGEQEGEGQPFRGWKGQVFPTCEPRKGRCASREAKRLGIQWRKATLSIEILGERFDAMAS